MAIYYKALKYRTISWIFVLGLVLAGATATAAEHRLPGLQGASQLLSSSIGAAETGLIYSSSGMPTFEAIRQQQENVIAQIVQERGAYGQGLDEAHSALGRLYLTNGDYFNAAREFRQAWHLSRINTGLYSEQQLPHLGNLSEALAELDEWEEVQQLHQLRFQIASKVYSVNDIEYALAAEDYTNWQWKAIQERGSSGRFHEVFSSAQELSAFYAEVIDRIEHAESSHIESLVNLVMGKARTDFSIARALINSRFSNSMLGPGSFITETKCSAADSNSGDAHRQCRKVRLASFMHDEGSVVAVNYALGRYLKQIDGSIETLERINQSTENLSPAARSEIEQLVFALRAESENIFQPVRRS